MRTFLTIIAIIISQAIFSQQTFFITETGSGSKNGTSWEEASNKLQETIDNAQSGDVIWVAAGTYKGGFFMKEGVSVFGGFSGNETQLSQRKLPGTNENLCILDGSSNFRVLTQKASFTTTTVWDGFVIQNGSSQSGAGVYLNNNGIVRRCIIKDNYATLPAVGDYIAQEGGVVFLVDKDAKRAWVIAEEDYGRNYQIYQESSTQINDIENAILDMNGRINTALLTKSRAAQAIQSYKGANKTGWYLPSAGEWALFLELKGNGIFQKTKVYDAVEASLLANGKTSLAGKKYWSSTSASENGMAATWYVNFENEDIQKVNVWQYNRIRGVRYYDATTEDGKGGGIFALAGSRIEGCLITQNHSATGSGVYATGNVVLLNNTIVKNVLESSTTTSSAVDASSAVKLYNTIIAGNLKSSGEEDKSSGTGYYGYSAVETSYIASNESCILLNNISEIGFLNASEDNYKLSSASPLANAGNILYLPESLDTDLGDKARTSDQKVSIGAYQHGYTSNINNTVVSGIQVYPNPVMRGQSINIDLSSANASGHASIEIYDIAGKKIISEKINTQGKVRAPQSAGTYIIKIKLDSQATFEYKLIVNQ
ncbi:MAG: T9SS type A sorting domain-containing protein [Dysgonomonas sp.]